jgi:CheY-like chemotaxis protein
MNLPNRFAFMGLLANMRVLVIEDDLKSGKIYSYLLEAYGATVKLVASFEEAIRILDWVAPDIAICEIRFPDRGVHAFKQKLRNLEMKTGRQIPVVFSTGSYATDDTGVAQFTDSMHVSLLQALGCDYFRAQSLVTR